MIVSYCGQREQPRVWEYRKKFTDRGIKELVNVDENHDEYPANFACEILRLYCEWFYSGDIYYQEGRVSFMAAMDDVIRYRRPGRSWNAPEMVAKSCRMISGSTRITEGQRWNLFGIFEYIFATDPGPFFEAYRKFLAEDLLRAQLTQEDLDYERSNLDMLDIGHQVPIELYNMLDDFEDALELNGSFKSYLAISEEQPRFKLDAFVLPHDMWPLKASFETKFGYSQKPLVAETQVKLPKALECELEAFVDSYTLRYNKKLTWLHHEGTVELEMNLKANSKCTVSMQTYHATILLLYEDVDELTWAQLLEATRMSERALSEHLVDLLEAKILVVAKGQEHAFKINLDFVTDDDIHKVKHANRDHYKQCSQSESESEFHALRRRLHIHTIVVRVMKSRKVMKHDELIREVVSLTRNKFQIGGPMISECIATLIDNKFLEVSAEEHNKYIYIP